MKTTTIAALCLLLASTLACDENKYDKILTEAASSATAPAPTPPAPSAAASAAAPAFVKKNASDCKPHPATIDFGGDAALEAEVRKKTAKDTGPITPTDLAQIKSINLATAKVHQIDPCIFPMLTSVKDIFFGPGEYDDLTPLQKLTTLMSLRLSYSHVKDLHAIEGLKSMDRLDISHTLVGDEQLKAVGSLVNLTELMLDEDVVSDISPVANLKKLEKLSLKKTGVKDLTPVSQIKTLKFLWIADTPVTDITPVQPLVAHGLKLIQN
ncbi:MAG TPA: leucine-rich repeat domain-containing protein [Polyangiaceae bacterium]|jgi:internalin A|nr:leucine-rich repeat domain-containing protein [Polyangiaceae bacterium]